MESISEGGTQLINRYRKRYTHALEQSLNLDLTLYIHITYLEQKQRQHGIRKKCAKFQMNAIQRKIYING